MVGLILKAEARNGYISNGTASVFGNRGLRNGRSLWEAVSKDSENYSTSEWHWKQGNFYFCLHFLDIFAQM